MSLIDIFEVPLREAHAKDGSDRTFQDFVDGIRRNITHPLHMIATSYNRAVYEMQRNWKD